MAKRSSKGEKIRTCFIAAPAGIDVSALRAVLHERGISSVVGADLRVGTSRHQGIRDAITKADLVIAVLPAEEHRANVFFELGVATGSNRPTLLVAGKSAEPLPSDLAGVPIVRADPQDSEAIRFHLDQLLASPLTTTRATSTVWELGQALGKRADDLLAQLPAPAEPVDARALESLVLEVLRQSGARSVVRSEVKGAPRDRPDVALWSDALSGITGNPLIAEIKVDIQDPAAAKRAQDQLAHYVISSGSRWGLLLYLRGPDRISDTPPIIHFRIDQLIRELRSTSLEETLRRRRNRAVHNQPIK